MIALSSPGFTILAMTSWAYRYRSGEHFAVWNEIRALGSSGVPQPRLQDAENVAYETMSRVAANVDMIVQRLGDVGYRFASPEHVRRQPATEDVAALERLEAATGPLPLALRSCLLIVGQVNLCGDGGPSLPHVSYHGNPHEESDLLPDPLVLPSARFLLDAWEEWPSDPGTDLSFIFAPDELHKANISGATHDIEGRGSSPDPRLLFVERRKGITLVDYLRVSMAWGGFPGYDALPADLHIPSLIEDLRRDLLLF